MRVVVPKPGRTSRGLPIDKRQWSKCELLMTLVRTDLEARYQGSVLVNFWYLLNQRWRVLIGTDVFSILPKVKLSLKGLAANNLRLNLWLFAWLLAWIAFPSGCVQADRSVVGLANLVKKVIFLGLLPPGCQLSLRLHLA